MVGRLINAEPLTRERFAPFGDVIDAGSANHYPINRGTMERFDDLAAVEVGEDGRVALGIIEATHASSTPVSVALVERHPLGSQAFIPMGDAVMCIVVAPPGDAVTPEALRAFVTDGRQGINYRPAVWHAPLVAFETGQRFLVVDRSGPGENCEEWELDAPVQVNVDVTAFRDTGGRS